MGEPPSKKAPKKQVFRERNWNGCSKTELEEECVERGLSKKGKKEDLIMRLIDFHNEQKLNAEDEEEAEDSEEDEDDEDDDSSDDAESLEEVDAEEAEKQHKREKAVQKAIQFILKNNAKDGFQMSELVAKLAEVKV